MRTPAPAILAMALACRCVMAGSPAPAGPRLWTHAELDSLTRALEKTDAPYTEVIKGRTYGALLLRRAVSGSPELHVKLNDFFVVLGGEGEIRVGGHVSGEREVAPDERRGQKLTGGALYQVERGDVLFVPANHWLQVLIGKGDVLQALIIKTQ